MTATHDDALLAAPYVLGALDPAERAAFEAHLERCAVCRAEVAAFQPALLALAHTVPQHQPRPELRARVLRTVSAAPVADERHESWTRWLPLAAALLVAASLGTYAWRLHGRVAVLEARLGDAERRAAAAQRDTMEARRRADDARMTMAVLSAPDMARIELAGQTPAKAAQGRALWSRSRGMVFTTTGLPAAPAGRVYQLWVVTAGGPVSAGLLALDASGGSTQTFSTPADIAPPVAVAVTLEPDGGVPAPTGEMYLVGKPS